MVSFFIQEYQFKKNSTATLGRLTQRLTVSNGTEEKEDEP